MKEVLIVGNFWPYVSGGARVVGLAHHLHEYGWRPTIVTMPLSQKLDDPRFRVVEVPFAGDIWQRWRRILMDAFGFSGKRSLLTQMKEKVGTSERKSFLDTWLRLYQEILGYPDADKKWFRPALKAAREVVGSSPVKAMISDFPFISHLVTARLKAETRLPWIADFPDLWSQNHNYIYGRIRHWFDERLERKTLASADALTTVSEPWAEKLLTLHPRSEVHGITHGYDPAIVNDPAEPLLPKFTITYTGTLYAEMQNPEPFFTAVAALLREGHLDANRFQVRFYGDQETWLRALIDKHALGEVVSLHGRVPKAEIVHRQRESHLLLVMDTDKEERGWHSLKIYDYLAAKRPVVVSGGHPENALARLVQETGAGIHGRTADELKPVLAAAYDEFERSGTVAYRGNPERLERYSHVVMARKFVTILDRISS